MRDDGLGHGRRRRATRYRRGRIRHGIAGDGCGRWSWGWWRGRLDWQDEHPARVDPARVGQGPAIGLQPSLVEGEELPPPQRVAEQGLGDGPEGVVADHGVGARRGRSGRQVELGAGTDRCQATVATTASAGVDLGGSSVRLEARWWAWGRARSQGGEEHGGDQPGGHRLEGPATGMRLDRPTPDGGHDLLGDRKQRR